MADAAGVLSILSTLADLVFQAAENNDKEEYSDERKRIEKWNENEDKKAKEQARYDAKRNALGNAIGTSIKSLYRDPYDPQYKKQDPYETEDWISTGRGISSLSNSVGSWLGSGSDSSTGETSSSGSGYIPRSQRGYDINFEMPNYDSFA